MTLNEQSDLFPSLFPHLRMKIRLRVDDFVISFIDEKTYFFHLSAKFSHHDSAFGFVLISLDNSFVFIWVVICDLISLGEGVVIDLSRSIVSEAT